MVNLKVLWNYQCFVRSRTYAINSYKSYMTCYIRVFEIYNHAENKSKIIFYLQRSLIGEQNNYTTSVLFALDLETTRCSRMFSAQAAREMLQLKEYIELVHSLFLCILPPTVVQQHLYVVSKAQV